MSFIFNLVPRTFTKMINELAFYTGLSDSSAFQWLKHRHICYIPKPRKDPTQISNLRPLSLLECLYKTVTRIFSFRLLSVQKSAISENQHGFCSSRSCHSAIFPILSSLSKEIGRAHV